MSSSVVKQDERNHSFFWLKIIFDSFKKNLRKGKFWRKKMPYSPPSFSGCNESGYIMASN